MAKEKHQCAEMIWVSGGWHRVPCSTNASYFEDGKWWCGTHAPSKVAAKKAAWNAKFEAEQAELKKSAAEEKRKREFEAAMIAFARILIKRITLIDKCGSFDQVHMLGHEVIDEKKRIVAKFGDLLGKGD